MCKSNILQTYNTDSILNIVLGLETTSKGTITSSDRHPIQLDDLPVFRHLPQPWKPRVLHRCSRVKAFAYSTSDKGNPLFPKKLNQSFFLRNQSVNLRSLLVK